MSYGYHVSRKGTVLETVKLAHLNGLKAIQLFIGSPRTFTTRLDAEMRVDFTASAIYATQHGVKLFVHAPYIYNLVGKKGQFNQGAYDRVVKCLAKDLEACNLLNAKLVLHSGSSERNKETYALMASTIDKAFETWGGQASKNLLLLENCAGEGTKIGYLSELHAIISSVSEKYRDCVGVCIDTCHLFGAGEFKMDSGESIGELFTVIDRFFPGKVELFHLNDSEKPFASHADRHACAGTGMIWCSKQQPFVNIIHNCILRDIAMVSESPNGYADMQLIKLVIREM